MDDTHHYGTRHPGGFGMGDLQIIGATPPTPLIVVPALSVITTELGKRPLWQKGSPFGVPPDLFKAAYEELEAIMKKRGYRLAIDLPLKKCGIDNFILYGTPIVKADQVLNG